MSRPLRRNEARWARSKAEREEDEEEVALRRNYGSECQPKLWRGEVKRRVHLLPEGPTGRLVEFVEAEDNGEAREEGFAEAANASGSALREQ